jgi:hypothetical protein
MKVYIVTSGCYSDYHIDRVFLDKSKADHYAEGVSDSLVEEYNTCEEVFDLFTVITYTDDNDYFTVSTENTLDCPNPENMNVTKYDWGHIWLQRVILKPKLTDFSIEKLKLIYKKVCLDLQAEIKSLIQVEGWTEKMIEKWLDEKQIQHRGDIIQKPLNPCPKCGKEMEEVFKREPERNIIIDKLVCFDCKEERITGKRFDFRRNK